MGCANCQRKARTVAEAIEPTPIVRLDHAARPYLGTPFLHQGRNPKVGVDCVGLLRLCADDLGLPHVAFDRADYDRNPANGALERQLRAAFGAPVCCLQPGCIVTIDFKGATRHVGIVGEHPDGLSLIHTNSSVGRVTERRITPAYMKHITGIYRIVVAA